jgi:hypothetical protein
MLDNPVKPEIVTMPDLTLKRTNGTQILEFVGTSVDPGFQASANYFLEASAAGTNFSEPIAIINGIQGKSMKISVSELNGILLKKFPANEVSSVDFRLRSVLVVDAGTTAPGTGNKPFEYTSATKNAKVTIYGLPKLDLINSGIDQIIESPLGDGKYSGYVKLNTTKPFTLKDPDANIVYGSRWNRTQKHLPTKWIHTWLAWLVLPHPMDGMHPTKKWIITPNRASGQLQLI